jgi:hypothetical protein
MNSPTRRPDWRVLLERRLQRCAVQRSGAGRGCQRGIVALTDGRDARAVTRSHSYVLGWGALLNFVR